MAHRWLTDGGAVVYRPDHTDVAGEMLIRTDIPLMDNVTLMIDAQVSIWLTKKRVFAPTLELMEDLEAELRYKTYRELVRRVRNGLYDRNYSLYMNIRSCCWSVSVRVVDAFFKRLRMLQNTVSIDATVQSGPDATEGLYTVLASEKVAKPITGSDLERKAASSTLRYRRKQGIQPKTRYKVDAESGIRKPYTMDTLPDYIEEAWMDHLESCADLGIESSYTKEEFVRKNYNNVRFGEEAKKPVKTISQELIEEERIAADAIKARLTKSGDQNQPGYRPDSTECLHQ